jgi:hypothetical protein
MGRVTRDSRLKREAPRREAGVARKGESDGAARQSPMLSMTYSTTKGWGG